MAAEIESEFQVNSELIASSGGCFEVTADGEVVFSKNIAGRFPDASEVIAALAKLASKH